MKDKGASRSSNRTPRRRRAWRIYIPWHCLFRNSLARSPLCHSKPQAWPRLLPIHPLDVPLFLPRLQLFISLLQLCYLWPEISYSRSPRAPPIAARLLRSTLDRSRRIPFWVDPFRWRPRKNAKIDRLETTRIVFCPLGR